MMKELVPFLDYETVEGIEPLYIFRLKLQDAKTQLREIESSLDEELIRRMKEEKRSSFECGENKIFYANRKKEKIKNPDTLKRMLLGGTDAERELAASALAGSQSAWKIAQVRLLQDTLGLDLIETTFEDKIEIVSIPKAIFERSKNANPQS